MHLSLKISGALLLALASCQQPASGEETPAKPRLVAAVNGKELTEPDFYRRCERLVGGGADTAVGFLAVKEWLQQTIAEEEARAKGLLPSAQDIDKRMYALRKEFELRGQDFAEWLSSHGRTLETHKEEVRNQLIAENLLTEGVRVSDAEVALYYGSNKQVLGVPDQIRASRITVDNKDVARLLEASLKGGDFDALATKHSKDEYRESGGRIRDPIRTDPKANGPLEKEVLEKALKLEVGAIAGPIKLDEYWVFVRLDQRLPARVPELTDVQDLILANLKIQKAGPARLKAADDRLKQLQREANVQIYRAEYRSLLRYFGTPEPRTGAR
jgi:parvulin-like peptidyl-prolyl isomerase